ncbi:MAG: PP2C family protein-serine/threonine phosphatase [Bacteroidales bacterium]|jgi:sigma-B regulation protein RsbU (phosphoserine phosphatase)|nr:PP2C family protein-serine/threonine phosphatase [Bacteroidales bacterium]
MDNRNILFVSQRLEIATFKLNALLKITELINENASPIMLCSVYKKILIDNFAVGKFALFMKNSHWHCLINNNFSKYCNSNTDQWVKENLTQYSKIESIEIGDSVFTLIPVIHHEKPLAYLLVAEKKEYTQLTNPIIKHRTFIQTITNIIVSAIENRHLYDEKIEKEAIKKELEVASQMQAMLIPSPDSLPQNEHLSVATFYAPHFQVGGDYFDFVELDAHNYGFCIADVSGKGIAAALLMANFQANVRAFARLGVQVDLPYIVKELNNYIDQFLQGEKFITFFIARYNTQTNLLHYVNAGHNPPVYWSAQDKKIHYCTQGCVGLGMFERIEHISQGEIRVAPGDKILCYTDGLSEAENSKKKEFGIHEIEVAISKDISIKESISYLTAQLLHFVGKNPPSDDISILGIHFK